MIDAADCVVVFLTEEGLQSHEVLDEISRCHDRGKFIIPVVAEGTTLESLPWYIRDVHYIKYNERNFDQVIETIVKTVGNRANPLANADSEAPDRLRDLVDSGTRFIDIPIPKDLADASLQPDYIFCELKMRETNQVFVFRAAATMPIGEIAAYLALKLLPLTQVASYEWTLIYHYNELPEYHTLETSGIASGDVVFLKGYHRRPVIQLKLLD